NEGRRMNRRRASDQPDMFGTTIQPRPAKAEAKPFYDDVLLLRASGLPVYRAGHDHKVAGRILSTAQLAAMAAARRGRRKFHPIKIGDRA
ncbi:MAG: hypothetical protein WCD42_02360, partial [Rhizomicrobium sp.]